MIVVDKGSFPTLFKKLWGFISADNLNGGFRRSGLCPFNSFAVSLGKCLNPEEDVTIPDDIGSPSTLLREAIVNSIAPTPLPETLVAFEIPEKNENVSRIYMVNFDYQRSGRLSAAEAKGEGC